MEDNNKEINTIKLLKEGNSIAFEELYNAYCLRLSNFVQNLTNDTYKTDDIVQDTFVKLWNNRKRLDVKLPLYPYLSRIAYNLFTDDYRRNNRKSILLDELYYKKVASLELEDRSIKNKKIDAIFKQIELLPPKCKNIFLLSKMEGLKYAEIADKLNVSVKTVENQIGIAFSKLRENLKEFQKG